MSFFAYLNKVDDKGNFEKFNGEYIKVSHFDDLASQKLIVPFKIIDLLNNKKEYQMEFKVGFFGCDQNEKKEVFPVKGWIVSSCS